MFVTGLRRLFAVSAVAVLLVVLALPTPAVEWFDNFDDGDAEDGNPVTWTYNELGVTAGIYDASSGDYELSNPGGDGDDDSLIASVDVVFGDTYSRTQAVIAPGPGPDEVGGNVGLVARWDPSAFSGYAAILDDGEQYAVIRADGEGLVELSGAGDIGIGAAMDVVVEFNFVGDEWSLYFWRPEESKPDTPIASGTDSTYTTGRAGIVYNEDDDNTIGVFRWAAAQDIPFIDALPGDHNGDGMVDAADYTTWRDGLGGTFDQDDYEAWKANFGAGSGAASANSATPEPSTAALLAICGFLVAGASRWR